MTIFIGSTNPVKINAVVSAASETWPTVEVKGFDVPSGIPEQPIGDDQTRMGAHNRALRALERGLQELKQREQVLGIGLEGGVIMMGDEMWSTVWAVVVDQTGATFASNGARFPVPPIVAERIKAGEEMGPIVEHVVKQADVRKKQGMIGIITKGFVDRTEEYSVIAKMALGLWYGQDWLTDFSQ